jgi:hypothetical protein
MQNNRLLKVEEVREAMGEDLKQAEIKIGDPEKLREGGEEKLPIYVDEGMSGIGKCYVQAEYNPMLVSIHVTFR